MNRSPIWGPRHLQKECAHPHGWRDKNKQTSTSGCLHFTDFCIYIMHVVYIIKVHQLTPFAVPSYMEGNLTPFLILYFEEDIVTALPQLFIS